MPHGTAARRPPDKLVPRVSLFTHRGSDVSPQSGLSGLAGASGGEHPGTHLLPKTPRPGSVGGFQVGSPHATGASGGGAQLTLTTKDSTTRSWRGHPPATRCTSGAPAAFCRHRPQDNVFPKLTTSPPVPYHHHIYTYLFLCFGVHRTRSFLFLMFYMVVQRYHRTGVATRALPCVLSQYLLFLTAQRYPQPQHNMFFKTPFWGSQYPCFIFVL